MTLTGHPIKYSKNLPCKQFHDFIRKTLLCHLQTGAILLVGKVGHVKPRYLALPLTVEPSKPRMCPDAQFLNLWMLDKPFSLDGVTHLPRHVFTDTYRTILDDKSGYDNLLLTEDSSTYFSIRWGGWYFTYNTLPFL